MPINNIYIQPQLRLPLLGSVNSELADQSFGIHKLKLRNAGLQARGLSYGLSIGTRVNSLMEEPFSFDVALSYSVDNFQVKRSGTISKLKAVPVTIHYYGIDFIISYD